MKKTKQPWLVWHRSDVLIGILSGIVIIWAFIAITDFDLRSFAATKIAGMKTAGNSTYTTTITNKYLTLKPGLTLVYESETADGTEKIQISIDGATYNVSGTKTLVYRDKVWIDADGDGKFSNKELVEDTKDYLAQHNTTGDLWYFGEHVNNFENGKLIDHDGTWIHGKDISKIGSNAQAGIWVKNNPTVGEEYKQEYYKGEAEDMVRVVSVDETVTTKAFGTLKGCLKTYDFTPLDEHSKEHKYYCTIPVGGGQTIGALVAIEHLVDNERTELVSATLKGSAGTGGGGKGGTGKSSGSGGKQSANDDDDASTGKKSSKGKNATGGGGGSSNSSASDDDED